MIARALHTLGALIGAALGAVSGLVLFVLTLQLALFAVGVPIYLLVRVIA